MSHFRAPAARADRREGGGRHGRPVARTLPAVPEAHIRPHLLRMAVLPPVAVALSGCAAVLFAVRSTGVRPTPTLWAVLAGAVAVAGAAVVIAAVAANRAAKAVAERVDALRRSSARGEADLRALVDALRRGDTPPPRRTRGQPPADADDFELLAADLARAHDGAVAAVVQAAQLSSQAGSQQKLEVFVNLARRLQSLVHREISILDELENEIEDPDLLKGLFHVDHLATRIRRHAENLAVLGGAVSRRQWSNPVSMTEVLRSAIAEVEQYSRVKLVPPIDGDIRGHAVADVIHLLAELVENATVFSAPHTQVLLRANLVTSGLAVEVEDRGLGMPVEEQQRMNALLADPDQVNVARLLADGRIGLYVVSQLARRHGIRVRLQTNIYGGVQAVLVVPQDLLGTPALVAGTATDTADPTAAQIVESGGTAVHDTGALAVPAPGLTAVPPPPDEYRTPGRADDTPPPAPGAPAPPLPVRGRRAERPTPASAAPGIRPEDRAVVDANEGQPPVPRTGAVRGTMGKPRLPRRRAKEHLVPQLRGGPAPRQEPEQHIGHDPGLMAAFQRGIGLADAQQGGPGHTPPPGPPAPGGELRTVPQAAETRPVMDGHGPERPRYAPTARRDGSAPAG
ncbi:sensor histidine kinase [Streptomyces thermocoprophilus]|uniref:histidine kinase n=1 Tax=Streptomyces thermocoprophilus TaxID=78356 RepID=A0ABV5V822_9ACTN